METANEHRFFCAGKKREDTCVTSRPHFLTPNTTVDVIRVGISVWVQTGRFRLGCTRMVEACLQAKGVGRSTRSLLCDDDGGRGSIQGDVRQTEAGRSRAHLRQNAIGLRVAFPTSHFQPQPRSKNWYSASSKRATCPANSRAHLLSIQPRSSNPVFSRVESSFCAGGGSGMPYYD